MRTPGLLDHRETVALMRSADLLFLPMHDLPPGPRAGLVPYKTYEYLAAERPILAAVPDGDARDMLSGVSHATLCRPSDVEALAAAIGEAVARGRVDRVRDGIDSPVLAPYERRAAVAEIAGVLDSVLDDAGAPRRSAALRRWRSRTRVDHAAIVAARRARDGRRRIAPEHGQRRGLLRVR